MLRYLPLYLEGTQRGERRDLLGSKLKEEGFEAVIFTI